MVQLLTAVFVLCLLIAGGEAHAKSNIVIGQSLPLTGPQAGIARNIRTSTEALVQMVNKQGGINGRKLVLKVMDDEFKPDKTAANIKTLVETDNAIAITSLIGGPHILAAKPVAYSLGLPIVGVLNGNQAILAPENSSIVHVRAPFSKELQLIVKQYTMTGIKRFAIFSPNDVLGKVAAKTMKDAMATSNLKLVADVGYDRDTKDFKPYVDAIAKSNPEMLIIFAPTKAAADLIAALKAATSGIQVVCMSVVDERGLYNMLNKQTEGVVFSSVVPSPFNYKLDVARQYQVAMKEKGAKELSLASFEAFINAKVLIEALRKAGYKPTRASLTKSLARMPLTDLGNVYFRPTAFADAKNPAGINAADIMMLSREGRLIR